MAPDPIALSIDDKGDVYLTRTNRQKNSEFDIRGHQDWMTESIGLKSLEERRAFLHKTFAPERSVENEWLKDLNEDGVHDWHGLTVEREEIWKLEDTNADGALEDKASIVHGFDVHIGFGGHGMSGAIEGPDGKIYWGIGDIGANLTALDGSTYKYPNQGGNR